jgi:hypothetical protein
MRLSSRLVLAFVCCVPALTYACSDGTGPDNTLDAPHLAMHFDSLFAQVADSDLSGRGLALSYLEIAAALGATPAKVTVTTADGTEQWKGYEIEEVSSGGCSQDTSYLTIAYRDADAHTVLLAFFDAAGTPDGEAGIISDSVTALATGGDGSTSRTSLGDACSTISSSLTNPFLASIDIVSCDLAGFQTSLSLTIPSTPGLDPSLTSISIDAQAFKGARVVDTFENATVRRAHAFFLAKRTGKKL